MRIFKLSVFAMVSLFPLLSANAGPDVYGLGSGRQGALTAASGVVINARRAPLLSEGLAGDDFVEVDAAAGFVAGDLVLIAHTQGVDLLSEAPRTRSDVNLNSIADSVGDWELARVLSVTGDTLWLDSDLLYDYPVQSTQVVRVLEYASLIISSNVSLTVDPWDGVDGGVGAVMVQGELVAGSGAKIEASGVGFRRGDIGPQDGTSSGCDALTDSRSGKRGEGLSLLYGTAQAGYGSLLNAGGGGNCHNSGGGGGANGGNGGKGGGAYNSNEAVGGEGGGRVVITPILERVILGAGGGAGHRNGNATGAGGAGGGFVLLRARTVTGSLSVLASGAVGQGATNRDDGGGGGGAGGSILIQSPGTVACTAVTANGGAGGAANTGHGTGGGGGGGRVQIESLAGATCTVSVAGGTRGSQGNPQDSGNNGVNGSAGVSSVLGAFLPDYDGDGAPATTTDCDDSDAAINPSATELPVDGVDSNCDGDELCYEDADGDQLGSSGTVAGPLDCVGLGVTAVPGDCDDDDALLGLGVNAWRDADGDGYGDGSAKEVYVCDFGPGFVDNPDDCDDTDATIQPNTQWFVDADGDGLGLSNTAFTACDPGVGSFSQVGGDCDDTSPVIGVGKLYYTDLDGDGFGQTGTGTLRCAAAANESDLDGDCDDSDIDAFPGQVWYPDADGDSYGADPGVTSCARPNATDVLVGGDCAPLDATLNPATTWFRDSDGDGLGAAADTVQSCSAPEGYLSDNTDCDDTAADVTGPTLWFVDGDGDGYGKTGSVGVSACTSPPGSVGNSFDCNDTNAEVNPTTKWYLDGDGDLFGALAVYRTQCAQPAGAIRQSGDCDDTNGAVYPNASEICNLIDDNCNQLVDDADPAVNTSAGVDVWPDVDRDGFGDDSAQMLRQCALRPGQANRAGDCNDNSAAVSPAAAEQCNEVDDNCNDIVDDGITVQDWYPDEDGDSYGTSAGALSDCAQPSGYVVRAGDCDDDNDAVSPAAEEICNEVDDDCDGSVDDNASDVLAWYTDSDGDGSQGSVPLYACEAPFGFGALLPGPLDCDDGNPDIRPTALETCDGLDNDCAGGIDDGALDASQLYVDLDGDGFGDEAAGAVEYGCAGPGRAIVGGDCDDSDDLISPDELELCDGVDNDCDGDVDEDLVFSAYYLDLDGDGWGAGEAVQDCGPIDGTVSQDGDCDDGAANVSPDADEVGGNEVDEDCDGVASDVDGDGFALQEDCDDGDASRYPGATEVPNNGVDEDCDGVDAETGRGLSGENGVISSVLPSAGAGCGCDGSSQGGAAWLALVLGALAVRRRRAA